MTDRLGLALVGLLGLLGTGCSAGRTDRPPEAPPVGSVADRAPALYFLMVDRFADGDPENNVGVDVDDPQGWHGGDLAGVEQHLDWIEDLGFTGVWLTPVFQSRRAKLERWGAFHGYWVQDPTHVDPGFGGDAALQHLSQAMTARGLGLWLDVVWNHVSFDSPLRSEHPDWFHPSVPLTDWSDPIAAQTHEVHGLPDLAQEQPEVLDWLRDVHVGWLDRVHPAGFRVDAVRHMPAAELSQLGAALRAHQPGLRLLGEVFDGDPSVLDATWRQTGFEHVFDFPLHYAMIDTFCGGRPVGRLGSVLSQDARYADPRSLVTFLDNHDTERVLSACGGDVERVGRALDLLLTVRGVPAITWGTEVGLAGAAEPENRADMQFVDHPLRGRIRRGLDRRRRPALRNGVTTVVDLLGTLLVLDQRSDDDSVVITVNQGPATRWRDLDIPPGVTVHDLRLPAPVRTARQVTLTDLHGDAIVGADAALGGWNPDQGVPVVDGRATFTVQAPAVVAYKVLRRGAGGWVWPDGEDAYAWIPSPVSGH